MEGADATVGEFIVRNLIPVTLGNIFGGAVMVGMAQWLIYRTYFGEAVKRIEVAPGAWWSQRGADVVVACAAV